MEVEEAEEMNNSRTKIIRLVLSDVQYVAPFLRYYDYWKEFTSASQKYRDHNAFRNSQLETSYDFGEDPEGDRLYHLQQIAHDRIKEIELDYPFGALNAADIEHIKDSLNAIAPNEGHYLDESFDLEQLDENHSEVESEASGPTQLPNAGNSHRNE